ncbi:MAG: ABC transporter ATP-binding protein [Gammaproteobacteria bacterium]|nr:ABC transporter ATP-binding protein [Gammaproteobacteria bacterium]
MSEPLLRVSNLSTQLGDDTRPVRAVDQVDIEIHKGETFALLGESGCGKSMLAHSIMRLLPPVGKIAAGDITLDGVALLDLAESEMCSERGGRMAMIFQEPMVSLNPVMTVGEQIAEAVRLHDPQHDQKRNGSNDTKVIELLDAVGIPVPQQRINEYPHQLSGGMKQRVMIAIALAGRPQLLIADEPTTALDVTIQAQVLGLLKELQQKTGMAILLITHDLGVVAEMADRIAVMYAGQIVELSSRQQFFSRPAHPYSQKLFAALPGSDSRNRDLAVIPGMVPPLDTQFKGCRFAERCDQAVTECQDQPPSWQQRRGGQRVRCHLDVGRPFSLPVETDAPVERAETESEKSLLKVDNLKVHFPIHKGVFKRVVGHVKAVDGLSLEIRAGRTLALVGESGCGKTTVGKGILQLTPATAGNVNFNGTELLGLSHKAMRTHRTDLQIIFQDPVASMNPRMLVGDIVVEGMQAQGIGKDRDARMERAAQLLEQVGLASEALHRYPNEFSGGQRQRICIARALAVDPKLIICDEPTSALDVSVQAQVLNQLKQLQDELGLSYLFITHNISVVAYLAHEVAVMYLGRIVEQGSVQQILDDPKHPYTKALLSAVPVVDPDSERQVIRLEGDIPSPVDPPSGCHFHPRCSVVQKQCQLDYPEEMIDSEGRMVRCFLMQNG